MRCRRGKLLWKCVECTCCLIELTAILYFMSCWNVKLSSYEHHHHHRHPSLYFIKTMMICAGDNNCKNVYFFERISISVTSWSEHWFFNIKKKSRENFLSAIVYWLLLFVMWICAWIYLRKKSKFFCHWQRKWLHLREK